MRLWLRMAVIGLSALALLSAYLFYRLYWQYRTLFDDNGRYFDAQTAVVYQQQSIYWAPIAIAFAGLAYFAYRYRQRLTT